MNDLEQRKCLFCGASLSGRKDKMYCDDNCRNNHYYNVNKSKNLYVSKIDNILKHNRLVLKKLCLNKKITVKKDVLEEMGFNFEYITTFYKTKKSVYKLVYDYAYKIVGDNVVVIRC